MQNPFATSEVLPGKLDFLFGEAETSMDSIAESFRLNGYRGQIVGPHGSGKSTLTRNLIEQLSPEVQFIALRPIDLIGLEELPNIYVKNDLAAIVIDGMEQLSTKIVRQFQQWSRQTGQGLLFTCHHPIDGSPLLHRTQESFSVFVKLTNRLSANSQAPASRVASDMTSLREIFSATDGNIREALFDMYDRIERRTRGEPVGSN